MAVGAAGRRGSSERCRQVRRNGRSTRSLWGRGNRRAAFFWMRDFGIGVGKSFGEMIARGEMNSSGGTRSSAVEMMGVQRRSRRTRARICGRNRSLRGSGQGESDTVAGCRVLGLTVVVFRKRRGTAATFQAVVAAAAAIAAVLTGRIAVSNTPITGLLLRWLAGHAATGTVTKKECKIWSRCSRRAGWDGSRRTGGNDPPGPHTHTHRAPKRTTACVGGGADRRCGEDGRAAT